MEQKQTRFTQETVPFVEALQAVLQAEDKTLSGFSAIYGDTQVEGEMTRGEEMYSKSGLSDLFGELINALKAQIGEVVELDLRGLLSSPLEKKEGVC